MKQEKCWIAIKKNVIHISANLRENAQWKINSPFCVQLLKSKIWERMRERKENEYASNIWKSENFDWREKTKIIHTTTQNFQLIVRVYFWRRMRSWCDGELLFFDWHCTCCCAYVYRKFFSFSLLRRNDLRDMKIK